MAGNLMNNEMLLHAGNLVRICEAQRNLAKDWREKKGLVECLYKGSCPQRLAGRYCSAVNILVESEKKSGIKGDTPRTIQGYMPLSGL